MRVTASSPELLEPFLPDCATPQATACLKQRASRGRCLLPDYIVAVTAILVHRRVRKALPDKDDTPEEIEEEEEAHDDSQKLIDMICIDAAHLPPNKTLSPMELRKFHSRVRCNHLGHAVDEGAARFPVTCASEMSVQAAIAAAATPGCAGPLAQLGRCARMMMSSGAGCSSAIELAVHAHRAARSSADANEAADATGGMPTDTMISPMLQVKEVDGERGYYAATDVPAGTVLLREPPHVFSADDDDLPGLVAAHVLGRSLLDATEAC